MLETVPYGYQAAVDDEGYVTINILHCSSYVIYTKEADASLCLSLRGADKGHTVKDNSGSGGGCRPRENRG